MLMFVGIPALWQRFHFLVRLFYGGFLMVQILSSGLVQKLSPGGVKLRN